MSEAEKFFRKYALVSAHEELTRDQERIVALIRFFGQDQVQLTKKRILRKAKKNRRMESGADKIGFVYISQLEEICK